MGSHDGRRAKEAVGTDMPSPSPRLGPARTLTLTGHVSGGNKVENNIYETQKAQYQGLTGVALPERA